MNEAGMARAKRLSLGFGAVLAVVALAVGVADHAEFIRVYRFAAIAWLQPALGCVLLAFLFRLTGGRWGRGLEPFLRAGCLLVPWAFLALTPMYFALPENFYWAKDDLSGELLRHVEKTRLYLNVPFFILRNVVIAVVLSWFALRAAAGLDRSVDGRPSFTGGFAAGGLVTFALADYLLAVDWIMSAEPRWYSAGLPLVVTVAQLVSAIALAVGAVAFLSNADEPSDAKPWKDRGNLLFAFVMFWFYLAFAQFLIIYAENLPEEITWYLHRDAGGWRAVTLLIVALHFVLPFFLLLSVSFKRRPRRLGRLALVIVAIQMVYVFWLTMPSHRTNGIEPGWLDPVLPLALGGLWINRFLHAMNRRTAT